jgi:hypothetical protein
VGGLFAAAHQVQPDARAHVLHAIHELIGVARALLDAADAVVSHQQRRAPEPGARSEQRDRRRPERLAPNPRLRSIRID